MSEALDKEIEALPLEAALAFAPLHKRHFGTAIGLAVSILVMLFTVVDMVTVPEQDSLWLLGQYFFGYQVTPMGILIGGAWGFFTGWFAGWFVAFCRNFVIGAIVLWVRTKANLSATNFLDHI